MIKKIIGAPIAYGLHYFGDKVSVFMEWLNWEWSFNLLYPIYNKCMLWSVWMNDWAHLKLWKPAKNESSNNF